MNWGDEWNVSSKQLVTLFSTLKSINESIARIAELITPDGNIDTDAVNKLINEALSKLNIPSDEHIDSLITEKGYASEIDVAETLLGYYTKDESDEKLSDYYTKTESNDKLADYYTKTENDEKLSDYYTRAESDTKLSDFYTKVESDEKLSDYYTKTESDEKLENYYTKAEIQKLIESIDTGGGASLVASISDAVDTNVFNNISISAEDTSGSMSSIVENITESVS